LTERLRTGEAFLILEQVNEDQMIFSFFSNQESLIKNKQSFPRLILNFNDITLTQNPTPPQTHSHPISKETNKNVLYTLTF